MYIRCNILIKKYILLYITYRGDHLISLSVCMIVRDEEDVLERCLNCVNKIADEIIVVDTGLLISTKKIAAKIFKLKYMILLGVTIFLKLEIIHFQKQLKNI